MTAPEVEVRELRPARGERFPRWEVLLDGAVIGHLEAHRIGRSSVTFYRATATAPDGQTVDLESHPSRENRAAVLVAFFEAPELYNGKHWHPRHGWHRDDGADTVGA
jgi:hypothetical protein